MPNLVKQLQEFCLTKQDMIDAIADLLEGRSVGPAYIVGIKLVGNDSLQIETDDGCKFRLSCVEE